MITRAPNSSLMVTQKNLTFGLGSGEIKHTFIENLTYELCFTSIGSTSKHIFFEFPLQNLDNIGTAQELGEGVLLLKGLSNEIQKASEAIKETLSKTTVFDEIYNEMETTLYTTFFLKGLIVLIICILQCCLFVKMIGTKTQEYKRISIPI